MVACALADIGDMQGADDYLEEISDALRAMDEDRNSGLDGGNTFSHYDQYFESYKKAVDKRKEKYYNPKVEPLIDEQLQLARQKAEQESHWLNRARAYCQVAKLTFENNADAAHDAFMSALSQMKQMPPSHPVESYRVIM